MKVKAKQVTEDAGRYQTFDNRIMTKEAEDMPPPLMTPEASEFFQV